MCHIKKATSSLNNAGYFVVSVFRRSNFSGPLSQLPLCGKPTIEPRRFVSSSRVARARSFHAVLRLNRRDWMKMVRIWGVPFAQLASRRGGAVRKMRIARSTKTIWPRATENSDFAASVYRTVHERSPFLRGNCRWKKIAKRKKEHVGCSYTLEISSVSFVRARVTLEMAIKDKKTVTVERTLQWIAKD